MLSAFIAIALLGTCAFVLLGVGENRKQMRAKERARLAHERERLARRRVELAVMRIAALQAQNRRH